MSENLSLDKEQMKQLGYQAVDMLVNHLCALPQKKVSNTKSRKELEALLGEPVPQQGSNPQELLNQLEEAVFSHTMHLNHPRFFAFVSSPSNYMSVLADFLVSGFNVYSGTWLAGSASAQIELLTIGWLNQIFGFPAETAGGLFLSGGSMANLTGLLLARDNKKKEGSTGVIYCSDQTHSSIERALRVMGKETIELRKIKTNTEFQLDTSALEKAIMEDKEKGLQPFCIVANAGSTNTGAVDELAAIRQLCDTENLWLHVDGAYGSVAILDDNEKHRFRGIELADSLAIDPHKWLFQPFEMGCLLVRDKSRLKDAFQIMPEYLKDVELGEEEVNFGNYGIQLSRKFRALKLWLSLKTFGLEEFKEAVSKGISLAKVAEQETSRYKDIELVTGAQIGIINFRFRPEDFSEQALNELNKKIIERIVADGFAMISSTSLKGKTVVRLCIINPRTSEEDIRQTISKLHAICQELTNQHRQ
jgi:aromatic-L-amino-acid decarboxylase